MDINVGSKMDGKIQIKQEPMDPNETQQPFVFVGVQENLAESIVERQDRAVVAKIKVKEEPCCTLTKDKAAALKLHLENETSPMISRSAESKDTGVIESGGNGLETATHAKEAALWLERTASQVKREEDNSSSDADSQNQIKNSAMVKEPTQPSGFVHRKGVASQIESLLLEPTDEDEHYADSFDSDDETEIIETADHSSDSEQSCDENETKQIPSDDCFFYIGMDQETLWVNNPSAMPGKTRQNVTKELPGPKQTARGIKTEIDIFLKFIDLEIISSIVENTNRYIDMKRCTVNYRRDTDCRYTSLNEIMAFLGALFLIAAQKGRINVIELWASNGTGMMILRAAFSYKRFLFLLHSLRFDDTSTRKERLVTDKLAAIRDLHTAFVNNCINNYSLGELTTVDEMLVPFRGPCAFIQHMPKKPAKYGLKLYALCDSKTFYTYNVEVYCGTHNPGPSDQPMEVVKRLVAPIMGSHRTITTDSYYSSYPLAQYLLENGLTFIGTLKKNKQEIPPEFLPSRSRETGSCLFGFQDDFCLASCQTKKNKGVIILSSGHETNEIGSSTGKSLIHLKYSATKGGVDTADFLCTSYSTQRRSSSWPLAMFFRYLDIAGINSQVIFIANNPDKMLRRRTYLMNLGVALMQSHLKQRAQLSNLPRDIQGFLLPLRQIPVKNEDVIRRCGRCHLCGGKKNNKTTVTCSTCNKHVCKQHSDYMITCYSCGISLGEDDVQILGYVP